MKIIFPHLQKHKKVILMALVVTALWQIFSLIDPQIFRLMVDMYISNASSFSFQQFFSGVAVLLLLSMFVALLARISKHMQNYYVNVVAQKVSTSIYAESISHLLSLPYSVFEEKRSGELLNKAQKAKSDIQQLMNVSINVAFSILIGILIVVSYSFWVHWLIGLFYALIIPLITITSFLITRKIKKAQTEIVKEGAALSASTIETMRNVELVKSSGLENQEISRLNNINEQVLSLELKKVLIIRKLGFIQDTILNILRSSIMALLFYLVFKGVVSIGEFFALLFYSFFIFNPLSEIGNVSSGYQEANASLSELNKIQKLRTPSDGKGIKILSSLNSISFKNVSFSYPTKKELSIEKISFQAKGGETIAFVGLSGSGKTTIVKLLLGLYNPTKGKILINDIDSKTINYDEIRKKIGYVPQETQLFAGTIRDNLLFVNPKASDEDCLNVLEQSAAKNIVKTKENILDLKIGEAGVKLSGGERQRLGIARALLRNPDIIIFDEATSNLDFLTEKKIAETIKKISSSKPNLITFIITHRLSTITHADKIYVLDKGKIAESGNHKKLLSNKGIYYSLWREQNN